MNLTPIHDNIVIQFKDEVRNGFFVDSPSSNVGIVTDLGGNHERSGKYCRIATVKSVGQAVTEITVGDTIVIDHLMWTTGFKFDGEMYWMTQPKCIVGLMQE